MRLIETRSPYLHFFFNSTSPPVDDIVFKRVDPVTGEMVDAWYMDGLELSRKYLRCEMPCRVIRYMGYPMCMARIEILEKMGLARRITMEEIAKMEEEEMERIKQEVAEDIERDKFQRVVGMLENPPRVKNKYLGNPMTV